MLVAPFGPPFEDIIDFLAAGPSPEEILAYKPPVSMDERLHELLDKNSRGELSAEEQSELQEFLQLNHFLKMLQLRTRLKLSGLP
jgi:hypothetical protein